MFKIEKLNKVDEYAALSIHNYAGSLHELAADGFTPVDVKKLAELRINLGAYHEISWTGSRTTDFFIYKNDKYYLGHSDLSTPDKRAMVDALQDFNVNRTEIPYVKGIVKKFIEMPTDDALIPTDEFETNAIALFLFGEKAAAYGEWLQKIGIKFFPFALPPYSLAREHDSFMRPIILRCTDNWSGIITANADTQSLYGFRGTSKAYSGPVNEAESFPRASLEAVSKLVPLEDRNYGLVELEKLITEKGYAGLLNGLLRMARNHGHGLPASYETFQENK